MHVGFTSRMFRWWRNYRERKRLLQERRNQAWCDQKDAGLLVDPIETDPEFSKLLAEADLLVEQKLASHNQGMGYCHQFWATKQRILKERFGIIWFSPSDMNTEVFFD